jgi:hypothetical protein
MIIFNLKSLDSFYIYLFSLFSGGFFIKYYISTNKDILNSQVIEFITLNLIVILINLVFFLAFHQAYSSSL